MTTFATIQRLTQALDILAAARHELTAAGEVQATSHIARAMSEVRRAKDRAWTRYNTEARS
jgi:hypothetical protein